MATETTQPLDKAPRMILVKPDEKEEKDFLDAVNDTIKDTEKVSEALFPVKEEKLDPLAVVIRGKYEETQRQRTDLENVWLDDLRQIRGIYSPDVLAKMHPSRSKANIRLTRTKVKTVNSRQGDFLLPSTGERNWGIKPTPISKLDPRLTAQIIAAFMQEGNQQPSDKEIRLAIQKEADARAEAMSKKIEDQLASLRYRDIMKDVLNSGNTYGTGILKGPMVNIKRGSKYEKDEDGRWAMREFDDLAPFIEAVAIWDIFPDLSATRIEDCSFIIQRHKMSKHKFLELAKRKDFNGELIYKYSAEQEQGDFDEQYYDVELQALGGIETKSSEETSDVKKYEVLEFWGYLDSHDLEQAAVKIPENKKGSAQIACNVWVVGNHVIKACLVPLEGVQWPYYFYYYDKDETSIFGQGIPYIMRDVQELINASFRGMLDNAAISAGPQIEVNMDLLPEDEDPTDIYPFKVWPRTGHMADAGSPMLRVIDVPSQTQNFLLMNEAFEKYGDEVTTIPRYMWGDDPGSGAGRTASGLSMMMGSANITIKDQVKNFDDGITKPFITAMYHWNMQFGDDESIKGDYDVQAMGSSSLIAKEVYANSLMQFANIASSEQFAPLVKHDKMLRSIVDVLDLEGKDLVKSEQEVAVEQQQAAQQQAEYQQFMTNITETAREHGISPQDMLDQGQALFAQQKQQQQAAVQQGR